MSKEINEENTEELTAQSRIYSHKKVKFGIYMTLFGYLVLLVGAKPGLFGFDRSPVIGFMQTATFLVGIGLICIGGYFALMSFWPKGFTSLTADFAVRFVLTGFAIAVFSGMADVIGIGSHPMTGVPFFGKLQSFGVELGEFVIGVGFVMMIIPPFSQIEFRHEDNTAKIDMFEE